MSSADFDLLIVGGGLVGASLACALRGTGLSIGLIEAVPMAQAAADGESRALALAYGSRRLFERFDVWEAIGRREITPIERIHVSDRGHFGCARLAAADVGLDALGYVVAAHDLAAALYEPLTGHERITLFCPAVVEVVAIDEHQAHVTIRRDGRAETLSARLVVAADGASSPVREMVGIRVVRTDYGQAAVVARANIERPHLNTAYERFTDSGPLAVLPTGTDRCTVVWSARTDDADAILGWDDATFRDRLQERFGDRLGRFDHIGPRRRYSLALTRAAEPVRPRLALIGNAAHTVHPVAGQGFNLGLRDVAVLAEILIEACALRRDPGDPALLQRYVERRQGDTGTTTAFTHSLIRVFSNDYFPLSALRGAALVAVDLLPPLKRRLIRLTSGLSERAVGRPLPRSDVRSPGD